MSIDYISDLHLNYHLHTKSHIDLLTKLIDFNNISDILIIAGDIGDDNKQNFSVLKFLSSFYKNIIITLGNHEYYSENSISRIIDFKSMINKEKNIHLLDGNIVKINGIRFGGAMGWYDGTYIMKYFNKYYTQNITKINIKWKNIMSFDRKNISHITNFYTLFEQELPKIESIYQKADVMITHINPSNLREHQNPEYINEYSTGFFCFDGLKYLEKTTAKFWIFGHTHAKVDYEYNNTKVLSNPLGYPNENFSFKMHHFNYVI